MTTITNKILEENYKACKVCKSLTKLIEKHINEKHRHELEINVKKEINREVSKK